MKKKWLLILIPVCIVGYLLCGTVTLITSDFSFGSTYKHPVNEEYTPYTMSATYTFALTKVSFELPVLTNSEVNPEKTGTYEVNYWALFHQKGYLVSVVDEIAPQITLNWDEDYFIEETDEYIEEGFSATDNYDGNLTERVVVSEMVDGIITYTVEDTSGNIGRVERRVKFVDHVPPVITCAKDFLSVKVGGALPSELCNAYDDVDGDLSDRVVIEGEVNTNRVGVYTLTYRVSDRFGNETTAKQEVYVYDKQPDSRLSNPTSKVIYLTFDDGPSAYTEKLLNILDEYNVKATFFVTGNTTYRNMIGEAYRRGHGIGIHTLTHNYSKCYGSVEGFYDDFYAMDSIIYEQTGIHTKISRFPGGSSNTISKQHCTGIMTTLTQSVSSKGYHYFDWNVSSGDAGSATTMEECRNNVIAGCRVRNWCVVLQHDTKGCSVEAVRQICEWGIANGYTFLPITYETSQTHHPVWN